MSAKTGSERLDRIVEYVASQHRRAVGSDDWHPVFDADYRWEHTQRVAHYGEIIARGEGIDRERSLAACLLHDIAYFHSDSEEDWKNHGRVGAKISRPILAEAGFGEAETGEICHAIAVHVDGETDVPHPHTPLADLVSDAHNIDRFIAYRVVLWCLNDRDDFAKMGESLRARVERLETYRKQNPLKTETGRRLFAEKLDLQIAFFGAIIRDADITRIPQLETP